MSSSFFAGRVFRATRLLLEPIIHAGMLSPAMGGNINGPSMIEAPDWLPGRLGRFYLYFAHHRGDHIRLAYADDLPGPWKIHAPGSLSLKGLHAVHDHVASPDVHVDHRRRRVNMYFHGMVHGSHRQATFLAVSENGIDFRVQEQPIADFYLRVARWRDQMIGMSWGGNMWRSTDHGRSFQPLSVNPFAAMKAATGMEVRHVALDVLDDELSVLFSRIGDAPEHIQCTRIDLSAPASEWKIGSIQSLLKPDLDWEGAGLPVSASRVGAAQGAECALRDPAIFKSDWNVYVLYSAAGEQAIGIARLTLVDAKTRNANSDETSAEPHETAYEREIARLTAPGRLRKRLAQIDGDTPRQRIYLMGCGRSGTWLLTAIMSTFDDATVIARELPVEHFGVIQTSTGTQMVKRSFDAYQRVSSIPHDIHLLWLIRHPFDVLTSHNPASQREFHVDPFRWRGEMQALRRALAEKRPNLLVIRYEDLVKQPQTFQEYFGKRFGLRAKVRASEFASTFTAPKAAETAMHGVRGIDTSSIGKYRNSPRKIEYLRVLSPQLREMLDWTSSTFRYELDL